MSKKVKNTHFAALKESRTRGLIAERRAVAKRLAWLEQQIEIRDPHRLERERMRSEYEQKPDERG